MTMTRLFGKWCRGGVLLALAAVAMGSPWATNVMAQATTANPPATKQDLPAAKSLLEKYLKAVGGKEAFKAVKNITMTGSMEIPQAGVNGDMEMFQSGDGKLLMIIELPGIGRQSIGFDGKVAWQDSELTGPQLIEGAMLEDLKFEAKVDGYAEAAEYFDSLETVAAEDFEGEAAYKVIAKKEGIPDKMLFFSKSSGLIVGAEGEQESPFGKMNVRTVISDYKKVGAVLMSHRAVVSLPNGMTQELTMKEVKVNQEIPADKFELPESIKKLVK